MLMKYCVKATTIDATMYHISAQAITVLSFLYSPPVSSEDEPGCDGAIHSPKLSLQELVLSGAYCEVVFRAHHNKVDTAIVKAIPGGEGRGGNELCFMK